MAHASIDRSKRMKDLLQRLWVEYSILVQSIDKAIGDDDGLSDEMRALSDSIIDTPEMESLRIELKSVGVKL